MTEKGESFGKPILVVGHITAAMMECFPNFHVIIEGMSYNTRRCKTVFSAVKPTHRSNKAWWANLRSVAIDKTIHPLG